MNAVEMGVGIRLGWSYEVTLGPCDSGGEEVRDMVV